MTTTTDFQVDTYEKETKDNIDAKTIKQLIAGILLIIPGLLMIILSLDGFLETDSFTFMVRIIIFACIVISILGGFCSIKRIYHRFALISSILSFIGLNVIGFIPLILIVLSDDEFSS